MNSTETLVLAGGCFWCTEAVFVRVRGVQKVVSGYANGQTPSPTYETVCTGQTGYAEAIEVVYDPQVVTLEVLLDIFFATHDPTTLNRQGADVGTQYRSGIYTTSEPQGQAVQAYMQTLADQQVFSQPIVTEVQPLSQFYPAEPEHQRFFELHPYQGYCVAVAAPKVKKLANHFADWSQDPLPLP